MNFDRRKLLAMTKSLFSKEKKKKESMSWQSTCKRLTLLSLQTV